MADLMNQGKSGSLLSRLALGGSNFHHDPRRMPQVRMSRERRDSGPRLLRRPQAAI